jgi:large subunit ribosomal protein L29
MKIAEIRDLSAEELTARITDARKEVVNLRFQLAARKQEKPHKIRDARRLLSQLLTIQTQKVDADIKKAGAAEPKETKAKKATS